MKYQAEILITKIRYVIRRKVEILQCSLVILYFLLPERIVLDSEASVVSDCVGLLDITGLVVRVAVVAVIQKTTLYMHTQSRITSNRCKWRRYCDPIIIYFSVKGKVPHRAIKAHKVGMSQGIRSDNVLEEALDLVNKSF